MYTGEALEGKMLIAFIVLRATIEQKIERDYFPEAYWVNTSSNAIVKNLIYYADEEQKQAVENLIAGGTITIPVHEDITYDEVYENSDNLWNFMFFTGYFRKVKEHFVDTQR